MATMHQVSRTAAPGRPHHLKYTVRIVGPRRNLARWATQQGGVSDERAVVTVVGGGLAGLTAAIACAEHGASVVLHEAHGELGGRARCTAAPYIANDGTHAFYDGPPWRWLTARGLVDPVERLGIGQLTRARIRHAGRLRRTPPASFTRMVVLGRRRRAPVERGFRDWATTQFGEQACEAAEGMVGPAIYDADPGRLSAAFVFERLLRVTTPRVPPTPAIRAAGGQR